MAAQPRADHDRARRRRRRPGAGRDQRPAAEDRGARASSCRSGYGIEVGGAIESSAKAQKSIYRGDAATIIAVLMLLMIQLQDMKKMALVLLTAPLGLIGVSVSGGVPHPVRLRRHARRDRAVRHDHPQLGDPGGADRSGPGAGAPLWTAIVESAVRRLRPIMLTALAAILAMIPLTHTVFWGPMAWAIMGGLRSPRC